MLRQREKLSLKKVHCKTYEQTLLLRTEDKLLARLKQLFAGEKIA
jgi:hypothetical protein